MLNTDDLEYESMYGEEEDYDEVPEMDSLEQPAMGGELPCTCLASRMEPPGVTRGCLGFAGVMSPHPAWQRVAVPSGWGDLGFAALSLAPRQGARSPSQHRATHTVQTLHSVPLTEAITGSDGWFAGLVGLQVAGFLWSWS